MRSAARPRESASHDTSLDGWTGGRPRSYGRPPRPWHLSKETLLENLQLLDDQRARRIAVPARLQTIADFRRIHDRMEREHRLARPRDERGPDAQNLALAARGLDRQIHPAVHRPIIFHGHQTPGHGDGTA